MPLGRPRTALIERLRRYVEKTDGCWLWTGRKTWSGYGEITLGGKRGRKIRAHRVAWESVHGPVPNGLCVLHRCDVRSCVRPDHLFLGTRADNAADCLTKARHARGERVGSAKLTASQVQQIRDLAACGEARRAIADRFGVSRSNVGLIVSRQRWRAEES